jgi:two-component system, LytTR family, response regulator LytT
MSNIRIVIVEDEQLAAVALAKLVRKLEPEADILAMLSSVKQSVEWFSTHTADLVLMDIELGDGQAFRIFEKVPIHTPVIFTTAYDQYAIKAFKANGIDYLLKPVDETELKAALEKYRQWLLRTPDYQALVEYFTAGSPRKEYKQRFMVQAGSRIRSIPAEEIAYFFFTEKDVFLCTREGRSYPTEYSLDKLETLVNEDTYFRINRKMLVSFSSITKIVSLSKSRLKLELHPPYSEEVLVSFNKTPAFREWLDR